MLQHCESALCSAQQRGVKRSQEVISQDKELTTYGEKLVSLQVFWCFGTQRTVLFFLPPGGLC